MKYFLLRMKLQGIKNIDNEISIDFYNSYLERKINTTNSHVKAIYGTNGSGKTAIVYAAEIYKNLTLDYDYLTINNLNNGLNYLINQKNKEFKISMTFAVIEDEKINSIYEHLICLKEINDKYLISSECLNKITSLKINDNTKYVNIYKTEDGVLTINCSNDEYLKNISMNLLTEHTLITIITDRMKKDNSFIKDKFLDSYLKTYFFASDLKVFLQDSDKNYINFTNLYDQISEISKFMGSHELSSFIKVINKNRIVNNTMEKVLKNDFDKYLRYIANLTKFLKIFKPELSYIDIIKEENENYYECKTILVYDDGRRIDKKYESTGIKKIINLYSVLCDLDNGAIVFIDEFDANIHDVLLTKLLEYIKDYAKGQFVFTTHNLAPMDILQNAKHSIDFLSDSKITSWKKNGNYKASSLYSKGLIEYSPFNIEAFEFLGTFGEEDK